MIDPLRPVDHQEAQLPCGKGQPLGIDVHDRHVELRYARKERDAEANRPGADNQGAIARPRHGSADRVSTNGQKLDRGSLDR